MTEPLLPADIHALADYERHAQARIPEPIWAYIAGGGADGLTARWNREAFDRIRLQGRVLADMAGASTRTSLLGREMAAPIMVAPVALQRLVHKDGEAATALGAGACGCWMTVSTQASVPLEQVFAQPASTLWFQLYMQVAREDTLALVRRAEKAGYAAIVVTVDASVSGVRNAEQRAGFRIPEGVEAVNVAGMRTHASRAGPGESPVFKGLLDAAPTWRDIQWLRTQTKLPLLLKGVTSAADAALAMDEGIDGIVVSNHGGRTLDTLPASIEVLPEIAERVGGRVPLLLDGGVRRGTDVLKAIALGASAVMLGQPIVHALAVGGAVGVAHALTLLKAELEVAMALTGCPTIGSIDRSVIWRA